MIVIVRFSDVAPQGNTITGGHFRKWQGRNFDMVWNSFNLVMEHDWMACKILMQLEPVHYRDVLVA
jgi:hypothetical protein